MAVGSSSSDAAAGAAHDEKQPAAVEADREYSGGAGAGGDVFEMISLMNHLPGHKRKLGLSAFYSGKSRSFQCVADAKCVDDLKKTPEVLLPEAKRICRRKHYVLYTDRPAAAAALRS